MHAHMRQPLVAENFVIAHRSMSIGVDAIQIGSNSAAAATHALRYISTPPPCTLPHTLYCATLPSHIYVSPYLNIPKIVYMHAC